jgi:uncharacterized protein (TIGR02594 family)
VEFFMTDSSLKFAALAPKYTELWNTMTINPADAGKVSQAANKLRSLKVEFYDPVAAATAVPWYVIGLIHNLECDFKTNQNLSNGDPLGARTTSEPRGRPPSPPFDWLHCSEDALQAKGLDAVVDWSIEQIAYRLEAYNGWGYRQFHPEVLTPYLWGGTNHYTRGKYIADHKFDPNETSDQIGAMALLRRLIDDGLTVAAHGTVNQPSPPSPPQPTGLFELDGHPQVLRDAAGAEAKPDGIPILRRMPVAKLAEADDTWWKVRIEFPDGSKNEGFAMKTWLRPKFVPVEIDQSFFAQACLDATQKRGINANFLIALADAETGIANKAGDSGEFGPFALTQKDWADYNDTAETGSGDSDRFDPYAQPAVAARMVVELTERVRPGIPDSALPSSEELYLARIFGAQNVKLLRDAAPGALVRDVLTPTPPATPPAMSPGDLQGAINARSSFLRQDMTIQQLRLAIENRLDASLAKAGDWIREVEPDLVLGPPAAIATADVPWMDKANAELGVTEANNPGRITQYFAVTTAGPLPASEPWCAAFVSFCIKEAGVGPPEVKVFSARAADWLDNGDPLPGPRFGAIAVTRPFAPKDSGHVGFVISWDEKHVMLLGGNQSNSVCEKQFAISDVRGWRMV